MANAQRKERVNGQGTPAVRGASMWRALLVCLVLGVFFFAYAAFAAEEALPLTITSNGNTYTFQKFTIGADPKGNTTISFTGSGFEILPFRDGQVVIPVWCSFISGGKEYEWENVSTKPGALTFIFSSTAKPETIRLYAEDDRDKKHDIAGK